MPYAPGARKRVWVERFGYELKNIWLGMGSVSTQWQHLVGGFATQWQHSLVRNGGMLPLSGNIWGRARIPSFIVGLNHGGKWCGLHFTSARGLRCQEPLL